MQEGRGGRALSMDFLVFALAIPPALRLTQMSNVTISLTLRATDAFSLHPSFFLMEKKSRQEAPSEVLEVFVLTRQ